MPTLDLPLKSDTAAQARLHRGKHERRRQLLGKLLTAEAYGPAPDSLDSPHPARKLINKLSGCGAGAALYWSPGQGRIVASRARCKARVCPTCGEIRAHQLRDQLAPIVKGLDSPRLITLTLAASDTPLSQQLQRLTRCFAKLRRTKAGKRHLVGGIYVLEITYNPRRDQWHPHLHIVAEGRFWRQADLADLWETITGDSRVVDIRAVHDRGQVARYVTKYVTKCQQPRDVPPDRLLEWCQAVHGLPVARPWGSLHGSRVAAAAREETGPLEPVAPLEPLLEAARLGDELASELLAELRLASRVRPADPGGSLPPELAEGQRALRDRLADWWAREQRRREKACGMRPQNLQTQTVEYKENPPPATYSPLKQQCGQLALYHEHPPQGRHGLVDVRA